MLRTILFLNAVSLAVNVYGQELEPRAYAALPKNLNSIGVLYGLSRGNILTDPALPISDFKVTSHNAGVSYVHTFGAFEKLCRVQVTVPFIAMVGNLKINGKDTSGSRTGFGDCRIRIGINLTGSPPLSKKEFRGYVQKTIVGVSFVTSVPTGLYHPDKRINIGSNRWGFKPEIGISRRFKKVYAEMYTGVWFFTDNNRFYPTHHLVQKPVFQVQAHGAYYFKNRMWVSLNMTWFNGGETLLDDVPKGNLLDNWRAGASWSTPFAKGNSLKLQFHFGAFTNSNYDYSVVSIAYVKVF